MTEQALAYLVRRDEIIRDAAAQDLTALVKATACDPTESRPVLTGPARDLCEQIEECYPNSLMNTEQVADLMGVSRNLIRRRALASGVGWTLPGGDRLFSLAEIERLRPSRPRLAAPAKRKPRPPRTE